MNRRGPKPKAPTLRIVDGTHRDDRHGTVDEARAQAEAAASAFGPLKMPSKMTGAAKRAWRQYIAPAFWLDGSREPAAIACCELWAEFMTQPRSFTASKHGQLRAYMSLLGLTDPRNRAGPTKSVRDEFFDD